MWCILFCGLKFCLTLYCVLLCFGQRYFLNVVDVHGSSIFCEDSRHAPLFPDNLRTASNAYIPG